MFKKPLHLMLGASLGSMISALGSSARFNAIRAAMANPEAGKKTRDHVIDRKGKRRRWTSSTKVQGRPRSIDLSFKKEVEKTQEWDHQTKSLKPNWHDPRDAKYLNSHARKTNATRRLAAVSASGVKRRHAAIVEAGA